jgi:FlaA1/EpsC-like NDP-sugar epimerase
MDRKEQMSRLFNIGNASDVGLRKGEKKYEAVGEQIDIEAEQRFSVLKRTKD